MPFLPLATTEVQSTSSMLNWADLTAALMILAGTFSAVAAARQQKVGIVSVVLFGVVGLAIGLGGGMASSKMAYRILYSTRLPTGLQFASYLLVPMIFLAMVISAPILLVMVIYEWT
jgi:hypothetical protein